VFISHFPNSIDAKGRVSIPASFRAKLEGESVFIRRCQDGAWLEGGAQSYVDDYMDIIDQLNPYDPLRQAIEVSVLGELREFAIDANGRIVLPEDMRAHAGLTDTAVFVGRGQRFQVFNPTDWEAERAAQAEALRAAAATMPRTTRSQQAGGRP
jgi:MraZ protein